MAHSAAASVPLGLSVPSQGLDGLLVSLRPGQASTASSPAATVFLLTQALAKKHLYAFGELATSQEVAALRSAAPEHAKYAELVDVFAYGTYSDLTSWEARYDAKLGEAEREKLRRLTVVDLARREKRLPYDAVRSRCGLSSAEEVEALLVSCVYEGLVRLRLNQQESVALVYWVAGRDVSPGLGVDDLLKQTRDWIDKADAVLADLSRAVEGAQTFRMLEEEKHAGIAKSVEETRESAARNRAEGRKVNQPQPPPSLPSQHQPAHADLGVFNSSRSGREDGPGVMKRRAGGGGPESRR